MDSDDSAASEVASDVDAYEDSFMADEVEEDEAPAARSKPTPAPAPVAAKPRPGPCVRPPPSASAVTGKLGYVDDASDPYGDDDYEADDDAYSVDFEDADGPSAPPTALANKPRSPVRRDVPPPAIAEDAEYAYSEASFEDESRLSQSLNRLVVDLSVPVRRDSNGSTTSGGTASPQNKTHLTVNANSPHVNLKVLSKPSPVRTTSPLRSAGTGTAARPFSLAVPAPPPAPVPFGAGVHTLTATALTLLDQESDRSLSLLLRKVESKYHDELETLRETNALLAWKERELKTELRILKDEHKMRKSRLDKKRKRAAERRREADDVVERLRTEVAAVTARADAADARLESQHTANDTLRVALDQSERERRATDARNLALAEKLQATLSDFHALNLKYEAAVGLKLAAEQRADALAHHHVTDCAVLAHKARLEVEAVQQTLVRERAAWQTERTTLPETHRVLVAHERERIEKLEAQVQQRVRDVEATLARETVRFDKELALAHESKKAAEDRAERRLHDELSKLTRERDALDAQRRELVVSMTKSSSRVDDERARLDATREQLEVRRLRLVEERAELDAKTAFVEDRVLRLAQEERVLEARKHELTKLGRETLEKSRVLAQRSDAFAEMKRELDALRLAQEQAQAHMRASDEHAHELQREKAALEKTARQLQHERLLVAKQRVQSREFLDGAKKLELLLHQQKALEQAHGPGHGIHRAATSTS